MLRARVIRLTTPISVFFGPPMCDEPTRTTRELVRERCRRGHYIQCALPSAPRLAPRAPDVSHVPCVSASRSLCMCKSHARDVHVAPTRFLARGYPAPASRLHLLPICDLRGVGSPGQGGPNHVSEVNESVKAWSRPGRAGTAGRPPRLVGCYYVDQSKVRLTPVKRRQAFRSFSPPPPAGRHFSTIFPWPCSRCHCSTPSSS